jgi:hypothetical protein
MVNDSDVNQVVAQVQTKMELRELAPQTIETYVRCIGRFITRVGKPLAAVKAKDVEQSGRARRAREMRGAGVDGSADIIGVTERADSGDKPRLFRLSPVELEANSRACS